MNPETTSFSQLSLREALFQNLDTLNFKTMTPIQAQSLPSMLEGNDVIAQAKTGSGKTAAFGLTLLNHLNIDHYAVQALVMCPTRELAEQVSVAIRMLARLMPNVKVLNLSGGTPMKPQLDSLRHGAHIIVGTPGRIKKHLTKETLSLRHIKTLVLDEADRMLDMGFIDDIHDIMNYCPTKRQTLLFSATYPDEIKKLAKQFMKNPQKIIDETTHSQHDIEQRFYEVNTQSTKYPLLKAMLRHHKPLSTLIFCNTKQQTAELATSLNKDGFVSTALNGDMEQHERDLAMIRFINQSCSILVATDVAARGLDIKELPAVINYDLAFESDVHTHRIGRTGRAGHKGLALSITTPSDGERLCLLEDKLGYKLPWGEITKYNQNNSENFFPEMTTLNLGSGKKDKIRPGDILGALTKEAGIPGDKIGKIDITALHSYVAIHKSQATKALQFLQNGKLKGRKIQVRKI